MWLQTRCDFEFEIAVPTPFVLMLRPRSGPLQWIASEEYRLVPHAPVSEFVDVYGNLCQRVIAPPGPFSIHTAAEVKTADALDRAPGAPFVEVQSLPDATLGYLLPSRYCESDRFNRMACEITAGQALGYDQVAAIEQWLRERIQYIPGSSDIPISAVEVNQRGKGVCRDLAHLGIALCRSLSIPARMVVGYLHGLEPMDMHAWFEAFVGGRWYSFDATQAELRGGYVVVGYGRDAADVAIYTQFGLPVFPIRHEVDVHRITPPGPRPAGVD
ncbi:transglutaminase family protein [Thioalkalivibrio sp. ALJT]|uniref:transglutaminase domain-containing protein n=1 Tax=Thioalkalivibrio sp. ALJT TaxID=1158146 RepID=UPI00037ADB75|nr:transglutaminase family protein [Thioalkalivibrio sp. ALJT]